MPAECFYCSILSTTIPWPAPRIKSDFDVPAIPTAASLRGCRRSGRHRAVEGGALAAASGPPPRMMRSMSSAQTSWPCTAPAARVMDSFISTPPMSLAAGLEAQRRAVGAHLHPGGLDVGDDGIEHQPRHGVHEHGLAEGRPLARLPLEVDRRLHVHERQRHELGEAAGALLQRAHAQQVPRPVPVAVDVAEHDGGGAPEADGVRGLHHLAATAAVLILSGHRTARTSSSRISAAVPGRLASPASLSRAR